MAKKRKTWKDKLTKTERTHLRDTGAKTLTLARRNIEGQKNNASPCWECVAIGRKLGIAVELTAYRADREARGMTTRYVYRLSNTGAGSAKYGVCEVCGKPVETTFLLTEMRTYRHGLTYQDCMPREFGHKQCLAQLTSREPEGILNGKV